MKRIRRITALFLCLLMMLPTQGMTALADIEGAEPEDTSGERIEETLPLEPVEETEGAGGERIEETLPLEPLPEKDPLDGLTVIYWNPGGSLPAELTKAPAATASDAESAEATETTATAEAKDAAGKVLTAATSSNAAAPAGSDRADGFTPEHPVKSLETALKQADRLAEEHGVDKSDITIYAMNPMEIPDGRMYVLNAGNIRIASWPGRTYDNDTVFYLNGGQLTLMNTALEPGDGNADPEDAELVRVCGGALQLGRGVSIDGRIVMDYRRNREQTEWEKASSSNAATLSNADPANQDRASASNWTEAGETGAGFDIDSYILNTEEDEWELLEDKSQASTWKDPVIELIDGFDGVDGGYLLELRSDESKTNVTLAKTLYADDATEEEFAGFFRLANTVSDEWELLPLSERAATVRDTGADELKKYYRSAGLLAEEDGQIESGAEGSGDEAVLTVKMLAASRAGNGSTIYWNPGPGFTYNGVEYPAGADFGVDGTTVNAPVKTLDQAIAKANGGTIVVMQTLDLGDPDAGDYLTTKEGGAWLVKASSPVVIPVLRVWEVNAQPIFRVPAGEELILEDIEFEGQIKDGLTVESQAVVADAGSDITVRGQVTAETGYIQINASDSLKDHPVHADSTESVSVVLFYSGINTNLGYRYTDVVVPTENLLPAGAGDQDKIDTGLALMGCYRLAKANSLEDNGGTSQFDWVLRSDQMGDDLTENPQNLELYAAYYYDAVYLNGVSGDDAAFGASCQYPVKTWTAARRIWQEQMESSMAARAAAFAANDDLTKEQMDKRYPYPDKIYICGTVTVKGPELAWSLTPYTDYDGTVITTEVMSHRDIPMKEDGSGPVHELPGVLVEVTAGAGLALKDIKFRNNTDLPDSCTVRVSGSGSSVILTGTTTMSGKLDAAYHQDPKEITRGAHIEALDGGAVNLRAEWTGSIEARQQGIIADGAGTTVTMSGGAIRNNDVYDSEVSATYNQKNGGGVVLTGGASMTMSGGTISGNKTFFQGGGVYLSGSGSSFTMKAGTIEDNTFSMTGKDFRNTVSGMGIYAGPGTEVTIGTETGNVTDARISGNKSYCSKGTGIYTAGKLTVKKAEISNNQADTSMGGKYTSYYSSYMGNGVGIYVESAGALHMDGARVTGNKVRSAAGYYENGYGAGIYIEGNQAHEIRNSEISGNIIGKTTGLAVNAGAYYARGGGIYYTPNETGQTGGSLEIVNTRVAENRAASGAGLYLYTKDVGVNTGAQMNLVGCVIENNIASYSATDAGDPSASGYGGGVHLYAGRNTVKLTDCTVTGNAAFNGGGIRLTSGSLWLTGSAKDKAVVSKNSGAGIRMENSSSSYLRGENVLITENTDCGLYTYAGTAYLRKSRITANKASGVNQSGGSIYFEDVQVEDNLTSGNGGGVNVSNGTLFWSERTPGASTLKGNRSSGEGGGIFQSGGTVKLDFSDGMQNSADGYGNNIYMNSGDIYVLQGMLKQPAEPKDGAYNVYLNRISGSGGFYLDPVRAQIEKRQGANPDAVFLNTGNSQLTYLQSPASEDPAAMPIDTNISVFKAGSVLVRPANRSSVDNLYRINADMTGTEHYKINYDSPLKDASVNMEFESGGRLPRRTQLGAFQDEVSSSLTNVVLVGEGVYLAGTAAGGSDSNNGLSPKQAVATFDRAKSVLEQQIKAKQTAEKDLPEEERQGYSPYIYICGNVPVAGNETWELDYEDVLFTGTNAAFEKSEKAFEPDVDPESLTPQVRRFASFLTSPMITAESGASLTMGKIIVDGMCGAVTTSIQNSLSPVINGLAASTVTLKGETQIRSNYDSGVALAGKLLLEGEEGEPNKQLRNIDGYAVRMSGKGAAVEMTGYSRIVSDARSADSDRDRVGISSGADELRVLMKDHSAIQGTASDTFYYGVLFASYSDSKIEMQDFASISYATSGIRIGGDKSEIHMNHDDGADAAASARIDHTNNYGIKVDGSGSVAVYMGKQSRIEQNNGIGIYVNRGTRASDTFRLEMEDDSAITRNKGAGIELYAAGPSAIRMTDRARITRNVQGIYEVYDAGNLEIRMDQDARISANSGNGIYSVGKRSASAFPFSQEITLKDRAVIGGSSAYTSDADVEDCGNGMSGIFTQSPAKVFLQDTASIQSNTYFGFWFGRNNSSSYNYRKGEAELTLEGHSMIANNKQEGIAVNFYSAPLTVPSVLKAVVKDDARIFGNGLGRSSSAAAADASRKQIYINLDSSLYLEGNAEVAPTDSGECSVYAAGKIYMDGTVKVEGVIRLMQSKLPITLTSAAPTANRFRLHLAEGFLGKEVVIPDGVKVEDAAVYLANYVKEGAAGLAASKDLVADRPNIILEGENNVYLSGNGMDTNDGNSPATAVRTFHRARELLRTGRFTKGANIYICGSVSITSWADADTGTFGFDDDWSFDRDGTVTNEKTGAVWTPLVQRYQGYSGDAVGMVDVWDNKSVTFKNIVLDGNKNAVTATNAMIRIYNGGEVTLGEGAVIQNNKSDGGFSNSSIGVFVNGGTLNLEGGIIQGMEMKGNTSASSAFPNAAAVYCKGSSTSWPGEVYFKSGQIRDNKIKTSYKYSKGAAVTVGENGTFVMTGGSISGNTNEGESTSSQDTCGAGIYVVNGLAQISGGTIRDNTSNVGSAVFYYESTTTRSEKSGVILSGGQISGNRVNSYVGSSPVGKYSPVYVNGPNFQLAGGGCDLSDSIYLNQIRNHIIVSGDIYQKGRRYLVSLNQGAGADQFHKGSVVVAPDGSRKTDVSGYLPYFVVASNPYVLDRGQIDREIATGGNIKESESLLLMQAVYLDGENGSDAASGNTPKTAVKTFSWAKSIGEKDTGTDAKDYYIIYVCGKAGNTAAESEWSMAAPAYMCRYTGFTVYKESGEPVDETNRAYYGYLVEPQHDLTIGRMAVYGRRSIDPQEYNGDSLFKIPANVTVTVQADNGGEAVFGRNYNVGQYFGEDGLQANLSSRGGAFQVSPEGTLNMSAGRIVESEATFGSAVWLGADEADGTKTGHLILSGKPAVSGSVYLDGNGGTSAAYIEPKADYAPEGKLFIAVKNDYNGRECVRYPAGMTPGGDELEYYSFEDSIYALYDVVYRDAAANIIELNQKTALYLDGVNGSDGNDGSAPEKAFRTLKKLYEHIAQQQASGGITSKGVAVYIVNTVTLDKQGAQNVILNNVQMKDPNTGEKYYEGYYEDDATLQIKVEGQVYFKRYAKPRAFDASDPYFAGYNRPTLSDELIHVTDGAKLTLWGIYLDGHSAEAASTNKLYAADGVEAMAPLVTVENDGYLDCRYAEASGNNLATSTLFLNNVNVNKKTNKIGTLNGSDIYEGSSAGIELREGGSCMLNHAEFRNLYLGDNVVSGGTDIYHNGKELHFYNQTLFTGSVFLEGQGVPGRPETFDTSRFLYIDEIGTPAQNNFQVLMRDPYKHRVVVNYGPSGTTSGPTNTQIGVFLLEERVKKFFYLTKKADEPWILELLVPSAVYIDGAHGDDDLDNAEAGSNPAHPVRSLKRAYDLLKTRAGNTISVVGTVQVDQNTDITGTQYIGTDGTVNLGSTDRVHFVRYIQPDFARDGSLTDAEVEKLGYHVDDFKGVLLNVQGGNKLNVGVNVDFDGHSEKKDDIDLPREIVVTRENTSTAPLMTVEAEAQVELMSGSTLHDNNNIFEAEAGGTGIEGGAIYNQGTVTVTGAMFDNNHAKKGDAAYQAGTFTIQTGVDNLAGHSFYLASDMRGTAENPGWEDHVLRIAEKVPDGQIFDVDMDHAAAGRDVIVYTSTDGYAPAAGADAEQKHFALGSTVPDSLFLVEAEDDSAVLELQDWKILHVEVPANIYLAVTRNGAAERSTKLSAVLESEAELFGTPEYEIVNNGRYDVKVSVNGVDNRNASAGITDAVMSLQSNAADAIGEKDLYLALKGLDTDAADGLTAAEIPLTDGAAAEFELGRLKPGSTGTFGLTGSVGTGFVDKYKDLSFPLTDTAENVQKYMDGNGKDGLAHACAKYLLKYKVEMVPPRR